MPRRVGRKDLNHDELAYAFQQLGCLVISLATIGRGVPDLLIGFRQEWHAVEVKNPDTAYGRKGFSAAQQLVNARAAGSVEIVRSIKDVMSLVEKWATATKDRENVPPTIAVIETIEDAFRAIGAQLTL